MPLSACVASHGEICIVCRMQTLKEYFSIYHRLCSAALAVLALLVPGQALAEDFADPDSFGPALSSKAAQPIAPSRFVQGKKAQVPPAPAGSFTMGRAVRHALDFNPSLGAVEAQSKASREGSKAALGELFSSIWINFSALFESPQEEYASASRNKNSSEIIPSFF